MGNSDREAQFPSFAPLPGPGFCFWQQSGHTWIAPCLCAPPYVEHISCLTVVRLQNQPDSSTSVSLQARGLQSRRLK